VSKMCLTDVLKRLGAYLDTWIAGHAESHAKIEERLARLEARVSRLEAVAKADKKTIDEVDRSLRQSWETLDGRLKRLERGSGTPCHQHASCGECEWGIDCQVNPEGQHG